MVEDAAGNRATAVAAIRFATTRPTISLTFSSGRASNATRDLPVTIIWMDPYGGVEVQLALDSDPPEGAEWQSADGTAWVGLPQGTADGNHEVRARARNAAGLVTDVTIWQLVLDRSSPKITILEPEDGDTLRQGGLEVRIRLAVDDLTVPTAASFRLDGGVWLPLDDLANLTGRAGASGFGAHILEVRVTDAAGNTGEESVAFELARSGQGMPGGLALAMLAVIAAVAAAIAAAAWLGRRRGGAPPRG